MDDLASNRREYETYFRPSANQTKWWLCACERDSASQQRVLSTREAVALMESGWRVSVIGGPHSTRDQASAEADDCWEAPG